MTVLLACAGLAGFVLSYEMADRMTRATRHRMRLAMLLIAAGCLGAVARLRWPGLTEWALLLLAAGWVAFLVFDRRGGAYGSGAAGRIGAGAAQRKAKRRAVGPSV